MRDPFAALEPPASVCLERTRSAVLNVLVVVGAAIAVSGWVLGRLDRGAFLWNPTLSRRFAIGVLFLFLIGSRLVLRMGSSRSALSDPTTRARRFARSHVISAILGSLAVPLGFAYGWAIQPRIEAVCPFWVVALAVGFLALPREHELSGFDSPMAPLSNDSQAKPEDT